MITLQMEKNKSESYPVYIGSTKNLKQCKDGLFLLSSVKDIVQWNYSRDGENSSPATDITEIINEDAEVYLEGLSYALRFAACESSSLFEWMIANLYEIMDVEEAAVNDFIYRIWEVKINIYEKKTKKERELIPLCYLAEEVLEETEGFPKRDIISMSMVLESFISWKCELLSMEEYYEIRDMFVPFGLGISQSKFKPEDLLQALLTRLGEHSEISLIKKLGKSVSYGEISPEICLNALEELYFDESVND